MGGVATSASRSIVAWVVMLIALILTVCAAFLFLLARSQSSMLRSAEHVQNVHLTSTVHAAVIDRYLWDIERLLRSAHRGDPGTDAESTVTRRIGGFVHLIEGEMRALAIVQDESGHPEMKASLDRVHQQYDQFIRIARDFDAGMIDVTTVRDHIEQFRVRADQLAGLHQRAYRDEDTSVARADGWRHFYRVTFIVALAGMILIGIVTRQIILALRDRREAERRQHLMRTELDHRVKNNLAAIMALAHETINSSANLDEFGEAFSGRISAMARTHEALATRHWTGIDLTLAASLTLAGHLDAFPGRIAISGAPVLLPANAAMPVCLVLHELVMNAIKHGALSVPDGRVAITWTVDDGSVRLEWVEHGSRSVRAPDSLGLGLQLIEGFVRHELRGTLELDFRPEGLACSISIPVVEPALA